MRVFIIVWAILLCLLIAGFAWNDVQAYSFTKQDIKSFLQTPTKSLSVDDFSDIQVIPLDSVVADTAIYDFLFTISESDFLSLNRGGVVFSLPTGFGFADLSVDSIYESSPLVDYTVTEIRDNNGIISIVLQADTSVTTTKSTGTLVSMLLRISGVINPTKADTYQAVAVLFDSIGAIIAGPTFSSEFVLFPGPLDSIAVVPSQDIQLRAGDVKPCWAVGFDKYGNGILVDSVVSWGIDDTFDSIGYFDNSSFHATIVGAGRLVAKVDTINGYSGMITVLPGPLSSLILNISGEQFVGHVLRPVSELILYDAYRNLKTDYDLSAQPIQIFVGTGQFVPDTLSDNNLLNNGKIDLSAAMVRYEGPSAITHAFATNGDAVNSPPITVSLNNYEVVSVLDAHLEPLSTVYSGVETLVKVVVVNRGRLLPDVKPQIEVAFNASGILATKQFTPHAKGLVDTISIILPATELLPEDSVLTVRLDAEFSIENSIDSTSESVEYNIDVLEPERVFAVADSFRPDTVYPGRPFPIAFSVATQQLAGPIASTILQVSLLDEDSSVVAVVFDGEIVASDIDSGVISYLGIEGMIPEGLDLPAGEYGVYFSYLLESGENIYVLDEGLVDSVFVLAPVAVSYVASTLGPQSVYAGTGAAFGFNVQLDGEYAVPVELSNARIWVIGNSFVTATNLRFVDSVLHPGPNVVQTEKIFIPSQQVGHELSFSASFTFVIPGTGDEFTFDTDFGGFRVPVLQQPVAQIIDLQVLAPNAPKVNVSQHFQASCLLANLSDAVLGPLVLRLSSNGASIYDSLIAVDTIAPHDTIAVLMDITAASSPTVSEVFKVDIASPHITFLPPVNNVAPVTIETPAQLQLSFSRVGGSENILDQGQAFQLTASVENMGQALTSTGAYRLDTLGGAEFVGDSLSGVLSVGQTLVFNFVTPAFDTTIEFTFALVDTPIDLNTGEPAQVQNTDMQLSFLVESLETEMEVEAHIVGSNLILPGRAKKMFAVTLTNLGTSVVSDVQLEQISFSLRGMDNSPVSIDNILNLSLSHFTDNDIPVSEQIYGDANRLTAFFDNYIIPPQQTQTIVFEGAFLDKSFEPLVLRLESDDIDARFAEGPNLGEEVEVRTPSGDRLLVSEAYVAKGAALDESFLIKNNPFNPEVEPAEFSYELQEVSPVEFRIFTLTGEQVFTKVMDEGEPGTAVGENIIYWDGQNDEGTLVNNGIYIVMLKVVKTGEEARMKVAVAK